MSDGPYIQIATFCEKAERRPKSEGNNLSIIGCITKVGPSKATTSLPASLPAEFIPAADIKPYTLAVSLFAGDLKAGEYAITLRPEIDAPSGVDIDGGEQTFKTTFSGNPLEGLDVQLRLDLPLPEGLHWFRILISGGPEQKAPQTVARVPLKVSMEPDD